MDKKTLGDALRERARQNAAPGTTTVNVITDPGYWIEQNAKNVPDDVLDKIIKESTSVEDFFDRIRKWRQSK